MDDHLFDRFYREVLRPAFPASELSSLAAFRETYRGPTPCHGSIALRGEDPVGGAVGEYFPASGVMLLGYLAVRSDLRGLGLGTALLKDVLPRWRRTLAPTAVLAEVEDPRHHQAGPYGDPVARLRLYDRLGAKLLPVPYFQPALGTGLPRVPDMFLICLDPELDVVPRDALLAFLDENIRTCEGTETNGADPEYLALREAVLSWAGDVPLRPLPRAA